MIFTFKRIIYVGTLVGLTPSMYGERAHGRVTWTSVKAALILKSHQFLEQMVILT